VIVLEISAEEWAAHPEAQGLCLAFSIFDSAGVRKYFEGTFHSYIPRPAPARLTDAEIEKKARILAGKLNYELTQTGSHQGAFLKALDAYLAEKARLLAERVSHDLP
jgi:hypothetical protein